MRGLDSALSVHPHRHARGSQTEQLLGAGTPEPCESPTRPLWDTHPQAWVSGGRWSQPGRLLGVHGSAWR